MSDILKANTPGPDQIEVGMAVVSLDGESIGKVKEVRPADFLVDRPLARDVYVPYSAIIEATEGGTFRRGPAEPTRVILNVSHAHLDEQGWPTP